jgi:Late competence development protein ComFB
MESLRNTIEDIVVEESIQQLCYSQKHLREQTDLSDVVAAALNKLPPMYASSDRGWQMLRKKANSELRLQISDAVQKSILSAKPKAPRDIPPISEDELEVPAHSLAKLQDILQNYELEWKNVPCAVETMLDNIRCGADMNEHRASNLQIFSRKVPDPSSNKRSWKEQALSLENGDLNCEPEPDSSQAIKLSNSEQDFASYMLPTACFYVNSLEKPVVLTSRAQIQRLGSMVGKNVKLEDVAAYALNRLPPMYVTNRQDLKQSREKAKRELGNDLISLVMQAIMTLSKAPTRLVNPIPLAKFDRDQEGALVDLRLLLNRDDVTWRNVAVMVLEAMDGAKQQSDDWRKRWERMGQIYRKLPLKPGEAELSLLPSDQGDVLSVRANTRHAFALLVDNPQKVAKIVLQFFPAIAYVELLSPLLPFSLTYTRSEMATDGIIPNPNSKAATKSNSQANSQANPKNESQTEPKTASRNPNQATKSVPPKSANSSLSSASTSIPNSAQASTSQSSSQVANQGAKAQAIKSQPSMSQPTSPKPAKT